MLDFEDFVGFAAGLSGDLLALRGVDIVHGGFYFGVRNDVGDQRAQNVVAEVIHYFVEIALDGAGDLLHLLEGFVEGEGGHVAEDGVEDVALDLALRIAEFVVSVKDLGFDDLILHGDGDGDEDVVFGFGFNIDDGLTHLKIDKADGFTPGQQELQARARDAVEFSEALHHAGRVSADRVHGLEDRDDYKDAHDGGNDEGENEKR